MRNVNPKSLFLFLAAGIILIGMVFVLSQKYYEKMNSSGASEKFLKEGKNSKSQEQTDKELKQKIGQMLVIGFRGVEVNENAEIVKTIRELNLSGVAFFDFDVPSQSFPRNILNPKQTKKLIQDLQGFAKTKLFIAVDVEGGEVNRLSPKYGFLEIPSAEEVGLIFEKNPEQVRVLAKNIALQLKNLGFNMNFAPVVDVNINPKNPIIGKLGRAFSANPTTTAKIALIFIEENQKQNIVSVVKHFPGHGSSFSDSHLGMADITESYQKQELIPYYFLQEKGVLGAVMTGHLINKNIDKNPASLSQKFINDILRKQIGFEGAVFSDDLQMKAISGFFTFEQSLVEAINAGADVLLLSNNSQAPYDENLAQKTVEAIFEAVKTNKILEQRINETFLKISELKKIID